MYLLKIISLTKSVNLHNITCNCTNRTTNESTARVYLAGKPAVGQVSRKFESILWRSR